jgi:hypothetical protein
MLGAVMAVYTAAALGFSGFATLALTVLFLVACLSALLNVKDGRVALVIALVTVLALVSLGSPSDGWDARSIWLFHGKRVFVDASLYSQLDGYATWSQNDYPALVPALMAGLAQLVGYWNESFPKVAATLLLLPPLLVITASLRSLCTTAIFAVALVMVGGVYLINGYMDALVAVYGVAALVVMDKLADPSSTTRTTDLAVYVLLTAVMLLLKNEAIIVAGALVGAASVEVVASQRRLPWRIVLAFVLALLPLAFWKYSLSTHHVVNDLASSDVVEQMSERLPNLFFTIFILGDLLLRVWILLPALVLAVAVRRADGRRLVRISLLAASAYVSVLYVVYMSTPHDVKWHLQTSSSRTIMPVALILAYAAIRAVDVKLWANKK